MIFGSPKRYKQGPGTLTHCGQELSLLASRVILLSDPYIDNLVGSVIQNDAYLHGVDVHRLVFQGEVTPPEVERLVQQAEKLNAQLVLAAGGGKCLDAGKALANRLDIAVATAPTIASNDAPTSHIYVLYDKDHRLLSVEKLKRGNPDLVLVDSQIILSAPRHQLIAGIGDAISKCFEVRQCAMNHGRNVFGGRVTYTAEVLAKLCYQQIMMHSLPALQAHDAQRLDEHFERLIEATILLSGLSFENGGLSIAHASTRGLSAIPGLHNSPHGFQVAYGLLIQLKLERVPQKEYEQLIQFYRQVGLPTTLQELGIEENTPENWETIASLTHNTPHTKNFAYELQVADLVDAIATLESANQ